MRESNIPISNRPESSGVVIDISIACPMPLDLSRVKSVGRKILVDHGYQAGEISIAVFDGETIRDLNRQYLNHDYETDVLSFVLDRDQANGCLNGEVIVSATTAVRLAEEHGIAAEDEMLLYIMHGLLHLVGLNDKSRSERILMRNAEQRYADWLGISYVTPAAEEMEGGSA